MVFRGDMMVKGITRRVVVIKSPDPQVFDEAIFIVKEDASKKSGVTNEEILRQAQDTARNYIKTHRGGKKILNLPPPVYAALGACATGLIWMLTTFIH